MESIYTLQTVEVLVFLVLLADNVETNSNPLVSEHCVLLDGNTRSIRNKLEYIKYNFVDFDILCFTVMHLDIWFAREDLLLSDNFGSLYPKDRTNHRE